MQAYEISRNVDVPPTFAGDLVAVRAIVRTIPRGARDDVRVSLVDFPSDKPAFLQLLNGRPLVGVVKRRWRPGPRGGRLVEVDLDDI